MPMLCAFMLNRVRCEERFYGESSMFSKQMCGVIGRVQGTQGSLCPTHRQIDVCTLCAAAVDYGEGRNPLHGSNRHRMNNLRPKHCQVLEKRTSLAGRRDQPDGSKSKICTKCRYECDALASVVAAAPADDADDDADGGDGGGGGSGGGDFIIEATRLLSERAGRMEQKGRTGRLQHAVVVLRRGDQDDVKFVRDDVSLATMIAVRMHCAHGCTWLLMHACSIDSACLLL